MNIFRNILGFIEDDDQSLRLGATRRRLLREYGSLRYKTIADSRQEMRGDMMRLRNDFCKALTEAENEQ